MQNKFQGQKQTPRSISVPEQCYRNNHLLEFLSSYQSVPNHILTQQRGKLKPRRLQKANCTFSTGSDTSQHLLQLWRSKESVAAHKSNWLQLADQYGGKCYRLADFPTSRSCIPQRTGQRNAWPVRRTDLNYTTLHNRNKNIPTHNLKTVQPISSICGIDHSPVSKTCKSSTYDATAPSGSSPPSKGAPILPCPQPVS